MATENLLDLEKNAEMSPIKDELLASYSNKTLDNFGRKLKKRRN